jgi:cytochrome c5
MNKNSSRLFTIIVLVLGGVGLFLAGALLSRTMPMMGMMGLCGGTGQGMMDQRQMKEMMQGMMSGILPPGIEPHNLPEPESQGARVLSTYCSQCHNLPSPRMHPAEDWPRVASRMLIRERMMAGMRGMMMQVKAPTSQEEEILMQYLKTHALQALASGTVPAPDTVGAALFQQTCSQCHALPNPKQHVASEWPAVVARMQQNMSAMGRRAMTAREAKETLAYLERASD